MKRSVALLLTMGCMACGGTSSGSFHDELKFGTGIDGTGFGLVGVAESFSLAANRSLYFRFESQAKFDNRFVRLYFNKLEQKDFSACAAVDSHICLSSFTVSNAGTYNVEAFLVKTVVDIGQETLVASRTLTLTP